MWKYDVLMGHNVKTFKICDHFATYSISKSPIYKSQAKTESTFYYNNLCVTDKNLNHLK